MLVLASLEPPLSPGSWKKKTRTNRPQGNFENSDWTKCTGPHYIHAHDTHETSACPIVQHTQDYRCRQRVGCGCHLREELNTHARLGESREASLLHAGLPVDANIFFVPYFPPGLALHSDSAIIRLLRMKTWHGEGKKFLNLRLKCGVA